MDDQWEDLPEEEDDFPEEEATEETPETVYEVYRKLVRKPAGTEKIRAYNAEFDRNPEQWQRMSSVFEEPEETGQDRKKRRGCCGCLFRLVLWVLLALAAGLVWYLVIPGGAG